MNGDNEMPERPAEPDRTKLPIRRPAFRGVLNQTLDGSVPDWGLIGHVEAARRVHRTSWSC